MSFYKFSKRIRRKKVSRDVFLFVWDMLHDSRAFGWVYRTARTRIGIYLCFLTFDFVHCEAARM